MSCLHVLWGMGKGKTTAAVGMAVRAKGAGRNVLFAQFLKDGRSAELSQLELLGITVRVAKCEGFLREKTKEQHEIPGQKKALEEIDLSAYEFCVLDEALDLAAYYKLESELERLIHGRGNCELVLTGHKLPEGFALLADYQTEFLCRAHPYAKGVKARPGIEF